MTDVSSLASRVFDRIEKLGLEVTAQNCFLFALELWAEDRHKNMSKGFERKGGDPEPPARSSRHGIE